MARGAVAPAPWKPRNIPVQCSIMLFIVLSWVLNGGLLASFVFMMLHWNAMDWLLGPTNWSLFLQIMTGIMQSICSIVGCFVIGFRQHIERSYLALRTSRTKRFFLLYFFPFLFIGLLLSYVTIAFSNTDDTTSYMQEYASELFELGLSLSTPQDKGVNGNGPYLLRSGFEKLMRAHYPSQMNSDAFHQHVNRLFDAFSNYGLMYQSGIYHGIKLSVDPLRTSFGIASICALIIVTLLVVYYHWWMYDLKKNKFEEKLRMIKTQAGIYAMNPEEETETPVNGSSFAYEMFSGFHDSEVYDEVKDDEDDEMDTL